MAPSIMPLDMLKLRRPLKRIMVPVQVAQPLVHRGVSRANIPDIALEVLHVDGVESHNRHVQSDISLCEVLAEPVRAVLLLREVLLAAIKSLEEGSDVALVGFGGSSEAGLVDAVVDEVVDPGVGFVDLAGEILGVEDDGAVLFIDQVVKLSS